MSDSPEILEAVVVDEAGERQYTLVCLVASVAMAMLLLVRGLGVDAMLVALCAMLLPMVGWRGGPWIILGLIAWIILRDWSGLGHFQLLGTLFMSLVDLAYQQPIALMKTRNSAARFAQSMPAIDLFFCFAVLMWIAAYCRLLSVKWAIFPIDRRRASLSKKKPAEDVPLGDLAERRSGELVNGEETARLMLGAALCAVLAQLLSRWLKRRVANTDLPETLTQGINLNVPDGLWQLLILLWTFSLVLIVTTGILSYLGHRRLTSPEAALYLQDQLWRQLRREQARFNRWLAWAEKRQSTRGPTSARWEFWTNVFWFGGSVFVAWILWLLLFG